MGYRWIIPLAVFGFASGIFVRSFFDLGFALPLFLIFIGVTLLFAGKYLHTPVVLLISIVFFAAPLGIIRYDMSADDGVSPYLEEQVGNMVTLEGVITKEPDTRDDHTNITVSIEEIATGDTGTTTLTKDAQIQITTRQYPEWRYGDVVYVSGELAKPEPFIDSKTGRQVDYPAHLAKEGVRYVSYYPDVARMGSGGGNPIKSALFRAKRAFLDATAQMIPEPHSALLGGLVVGAKQSLGNTWLTDFRETGIIHIVVLSGYNVTLVAETIRTVLGFLPAALSFGGGIAAIAAFAVMTGASATVLRASLMAILVIIARATGRMYAVGRALLLAGAIMLILNPKLLVFDIAFQLSFIATVGLIYVSPLIEPYFRFVPKGFHMREIVTATLATQIFVLPLLLYQTGIFSIVSVPVNLLVLIAVPAVMLLGTIAGALGMVHPALGMPFALITYALLAYQLSVVALFADTPVTAEYVTSFPAWLVWVTYMVYGVVLWRIYKPNR